MVDKATIPMPHPPQYSGTVRPVEGHEETGRVVEVYDPADALANADGWVRVTRPGVHHREAVHTPTHAELDAEAQRRGITFAERMTVAQKVSVLEGAS